MRYVVALALLPSLTLASPAPKTRRVSPLLIPMDQGAEAKSLRFETYINEALEQFPEVILVKSDDLFGIPVDEEGEAAMRRADQGLAEGKAAYEATQYEDAERKLRATLAQFQKAASAMKDTSHMCEALALYAAVLFQRGDTEEARLNLLDLMSLNPTFELQPKRYTRDFINLRAQVATSRNAALRGNANIKSKPSGARIFLDGEFIGFTPAVLNTLPTGKHLLRIERPGFKQYGEFVEVSPEDTQVDAELRPTSGYRAYDALLDKVASEVSHEKPGPSVLALGKALGLDRAIVGIIKEISDNGGLEVIVGLFDMRSGQKLAGKRIVFQGEEYGQLKSEVSRLVNFLLVTADGGAERVVKASDPLKGKHGMEEWNEDDKGGKGAEKTKKPRYRDPLDAVNGTEDW